MKIFTIYGPSWSCDLDHLNKLLFPRPKEALHEIWLQSAVVSEEKMFENVDNNNIHTFRQTTEAYLYYKLTYETKGSGELIKHTSNIWLLFDISQKITFGGNKTVITL